MRPATKKGGHTWWYLNRQMTDEVLVFKNYESMVQRGLARRVPHTSLVDEEREDEDSRQSIEVRCLVFH